jgi:hypothetical protein
MIKLECIADFIFVDINLVCLKRAQIWRIPSLTHLLIRSNTLNVCPPSYARHSFLPAPQGCQNWGVGRCMERHTNSPHIKDRNQCKDNNEASKGMTLQCDQTTSPNNQVLKNVFASVSYLENTTNSQPNSPSYITHWELYFYLSQIGINHKLTKTSSKNFFACMCVIFGPYHKPTHPQSSSTSYSTHWEFYFYLSQNGTKPQAHK